MTDEELRRRIRDHADADLPPGFVHAVVDRLPDRRRSGIMSRWTGVVAAAAVALVAIVGFAIVGDGTPSASATASPSASDEPSPSGVAVIDVDPEVVLSIETTPSGLFRPDARSNDVVFRLNDDGRAVYSDYDFGVSNSEPLVAYLTQEQVEELVAWAIGPGGIGDALPEYPRAGRGGVGGTVITVNSPSLQKRIVYGLPAGNLAIDADPAVAELGDLVRRLSRFSLDVAAGNAVGGHPVDDDLRARELAMGDPRIGWPASATEAIQRVHPRHPMSSSYFVEVAIDSLGDWGLEALTETCETGRDGPITGLVWLVDVASDEVLAVSPMWGDVSCLSAADAWREPEHYRIVLESLCGEVTLSGRHAIEVRRGEIVQIESLGGVVPENIAAMEPKPTLAGMLEMAALAQRHGADVVEVRTDPGTGHPMSVEVDWNVDAIDDELCWTVSELEVIDGG